ncbi:hypothetical protein BDQ17DRAFT_1438180 [Cyathus striatus]|nr:hypothetical protein BDQ17DRAFT_1438180 [Cyathus striatus]
MADVEKALESNSSTINVPVETLDLSGTLTWQRAQVHSRIAFFATERFGQNPPVLALVDPKPPGKIFFTDPIYGFVAGVRPSPIMPPQVYMFDPETGSVQVVVGDIQVPNGIAFSPDGTIAYVSDTFDLAIDGDNQTHPSLIYVFDVDPDSLMLKEKRAFVLSDADVQMELLYTVKEMYMLAVEMAFRYGTRKENSLEVFIGTLQLIWYLLVMEG